MEPSKRRDPRLEVLIQQAAAEVKRINPLIGAPLHALSDATYAEIERDRQELETTWAHMEHQFKGQVEDEPAAKAIDANRGE